LIDLVSPLSIALFIGIPVAVIVGLGFVLNTFREQIVSSASATGSVFASIFTSPITGFIEQVSGAFSNLPDIGINVPRLNIGGGGITLFGQDIGNISLEAPLGVDQPGGPPDIDDVPLAPDETLACRLFGIGCPSGGPPTAPIPDPGPTPGPGPMEEFGGRFAQSFRVTGIEGSVSFEELQRLQPGAVVGLFDVLGTPETEFLPFNVAGVQSSLEMGQRLRLSGQVFQDIRGIKNVEDLFA